MDTLVLSPAYEPMDQVNWQRAVVLVYSGLVEVLETYEDWTVRSPSVAYPVPAVVRFLKGAAGHRRRGVRFSRINVYTRDRGRCCYCGIKVSRAEFTWDHVIPRAQGGKSRWENIATSCLECNQRKRNRTPAQAGMRLGPWVRLEKPKYMPETVTLKEGTVPKQWRAYLRDMAYWHAELEHD